LKPVLEYRPLESPANWIGFQIAKTNLTWHEPDLEIGSFLVVQYWHPLHEVTTLPAQDLHKSWCENDAYFRANDKSQKPPVACLPIYLISVGSGDKEQIVYVGQTSSRSSRFAAGHKAITLLHAPKFNGLRKRLYRCSIVLLSQRKNEIPIEWVTPYDEGKRLLSAVEGMLIHNFQPELNIRLKTKPPSTKIGCIHIQNISGGNGFLHDTFVWP